MLFELCLDFVSSASSAFVFLTFPDLDSDWFGPCLTLKQELHTVATELFVFFAAVWDESFAELGAKFLVKLELSCNGLSVVAFTSLQSFSKSIPLMKKINKEGLNYEITKSK